MATKTEKLGWQVNTPAFLNELLCNDASWVLRIPVKIFGHLLHEVANRAAEINDPELNELMCKLALYEVADQYNKEAYDAEIVKQVVALAAKAREERSNA